MINLFIYSLITLTNKSKSTNSENPVSEGNRESGTHEWRLREPKPNAADKTPIPIDASHSSQVELIYSRLKLL